MKNSKFKGFLGVQLTKMQIFKKNLIKKKKKKPKTILGEKCKYSINNKKRWGMNIKHYAMKENLGKNI